MRFQMRFQLLQFIHFFLTFKTIQDLDFTETSTNLMFYIFLFYVNVKNKALEDYGQFSNDTSHSILVGEGQNLLSERRFFYEQKLRYIYTYDAMILITYNDFQDPSLMTQLFRGI